MTDTPQRLLIIDAPLFRRGVMQLVQMAGQFEVVGEAQPALAGGSDGVGGGEEARGIVIEPVPFANRISP